MHRQFGRVRLDERGPVALLVLDRPEVMNALSLRMADELVAALDCASDPALGFRAVVLTGEGRAFCSGADLAEIASRNDGDPDAGTALDKHYHPLLRRIRDLDYPFLTAVNGAAAGIGMSIALTGDLILAARSAFFVQAFAHVGLAPDGGST